MLRVFLSPREAYRIVSWKISEESCAVATRAIVDHDTVSTRARERQIRRHQKDKAESTVLPVVGPEGC